MSKACEFHVGDLITTLHVGVWRVEKIFFTPDGLTMLEYVQVLTSAYNPPRHRTVNRCSTSLCRKVTRDWVESERKRTNDNWDKVMALLEVDNVCPTEASP